MIANRQEDCSTQQDVDGETPVTVTRSGAWNVQQMKTGGSYVNDQWSMTSVDRTRQGKVVKVDGLLMGCKQCYRGSHLGNVSHCLCLMVIFFTFIH